MLFDPILQLESTLPAVVAAGEKASAPIDYQKVYNAIADLLEDENYDDGSYGPVFLRLAWHASGTYDVKTKDGGSFHATMRYKPEAGHGANAGLGIARERLNRVKDQFPGISYGDLWTLAGVVAIQEMVRRTLCMKRYHYSLCVCNDTKGSGQPSD